MNPAPQPLSQTGASALSQGLGEEARIALAHAFKVVRDETERRAAPLSAEDQIVQSMADASPTKWHRAHTTWFFEQFILAPNQHGYRIFDDRFAFLFNSYYVSAGPRHARPKRGLITRPTMAEVAAYRAHVDEAMIDLIEKTDAETFARLAPLVEIGLHHEQQHQELMLTDILHAFAQNSTWPTYDAAWSMPKASERQDVTVPAGIYRIGHAGEGFSFDNEGPSHQILLQNVRIGPLVTNAEWLAFMDDGGYREPTLWLSDGWAVVQQEGWDAPEYWLKVDGRPMSMTLGGLKPIDREAPVCHISYYEAEAFARWSGKHLPAEQEWEVAAGRLADPYGIVWQWTRSSYSPYPGYRAADGALGEYNGKFMVSQLVLRGSSLATPRGHARSTYRNFFYPHHRWQFMGVRLAEYLDQSSVPTRQGARS